MEKMYLPLLLAFQLLLSLPHVPVSSAAHVDRGHAHAKKQNEIDRCPHVFDDPNGQYKLRMITWKNEARLCCVCNPGYRLAGLCSRANYSTTVCIKCDSDTFIDDFAHDLKTCKEHSKERCPENWIYVPGTISEDSRCIKLCPQKHFLAHDGSCQQHSKCIPGEGVNILGTPYNDTQCVPCENGFESPNYSSEDRCEIKQSVIDHPYNSHLNFSILDKPSVRSNSSAPMSNFIPPNLIPPVESVSTTPIGQMEMPSVKSTINPGSSSTSQTKLVTEKANGEETAGNALPGTIAIFVTVSVLLVTLAVVLVLILCKCFCKTKEKLPPGSPVMDRRIADSRNSRSEGGIEYENLLPPTKKGGSSRNHGGNSLHRQPSQSSLNQNTNSPSTSANLPPTNTPCAPKPKKSTRCFNDLQSNQTYYDDLMKAIGTYLCNGSINKRALNKDVMKELLRSFGNFEEFITDNACYPNTTADFVCKGFDRLIMMGPSQFYPEVLITKLQEKNYNLYADQVRSCCKDYKCQYDIDETMITPYKRKAFTSKEAE